jgi:4-methyl-5(b-hydroxyethyl)-thiazole monophosphate biosynthesis
MAPHVLVFLAEGFEETEAVTTIDLLRRGGVTVTTVGLDGRRVKGAHAIEVAADAALGDDLPQFDGIMLPGGQPGTNNLGASDALLKLLRQACDDGKVCAAICAAPTVLAMAGLLERKAATCYPGFEGQLHGAVVSEQDVVQDGNIVTSRGVGTAIPFALALIACLRDQEIADDVGARVLYTRGSTPG